MECISEALIHKCGRCRLIGMLVRVYPCHSVSLEIDSDMAERFALEEFTWADPAEKAAIALAALKNTNTGGIT